MKTKILLTSIAVFGSILMWAQTTSKRLYEESLARHNAFSKAAGIKPLPQKTISTSWDITTSDWSIYSDTMISTYNTAGNLIESSNRYSKNVYEYNAQGKETAVYYFSWRMDLNQWDSSGKSFTTYDVQGTEFERISYSKNNNSNDWIINYADRMLTTYDVNNRIISDINQDWIPYLSAYRNSLRNTYSYNNLNQLSGLVMEEWDTTTSQFKINSRIKDVVWHIWIAGAFDNSLISSFTSQEWRDTAYFDASRTTNSYDSNDNTTDEKQESYDGNVWSIDGWSKYNLTYSVANELTESITQYWDGNSFVNQFKQEYSNFYIPTTTGILTLPNTETKTHIYPNPLLSNTNLTIELNNIVPSCSIKIIDILGKEVLYSNLTSTKNSIETSNLGNGVFFYTIIQNNTILSTGKLLIR